MSRGTLLSLLSLYTYQKDMFDELALPEQVDKELLINNILTELAELEVVYPSGSFMKSAIGFWSKSRLLTWTRLANVLTEDYDPFVNIKRDEVRTILEERDLKGTSEGNAVEKTNAYNSGTGTERGTTSSDGTTTDTGTVKTTETLHVEGDSAITDAQDVMRKEVEVRSDYDLYKYIINDFKQRFCILVY